MAQYCLTDGDRISLVFDWDGKSPNPYPGSTPRKLPDNAGASWVGKSYDAAVRAGIEAEKKNDGQLHPDKDTPEGKRAEDIAPPAGGLHASGDALNANMGEATMALEHPLDPVLGSEMRTPVPAFHVAFVPSSQPKTADQAAKDAGTTSTRTFPAGSKESHAPATNADTADTAPKRAAAAAEASDSTDKRKAAAGLK